MADFLELGELMCLDALEREESCGGHFREEYQTPDGEALRDDEQLLPRRGLGVRGRRQEADPATSSRWRSRTSSSRSGATSDAHEPHPSRLAAEERARQRARFVTYEAKDISPDMSFLEMLDVVNEGLIQKGEDPIAFDHDCREGICGTCGVVINGAAARAAPGARPPASSTCAASRTATTHHHRALARRAPSRCSGT